MTSAEGKEPTTELLVEVVRRYPVFGALEAGATNKRELADSIGVSEATAHRILASFRDAGLVELTDEGNVVTPLGREIARQARRYRSGVEAALRLEPLFATVDPGAVEFDVEAFADSTVTLAEPGDPYCPIRRFMDLLRETDALRGFDTTSVAPMYVEDIHARIADGMPTEIVYEPDVVERLATNYGDLLADVVERDNLVIHVRDDLPFGLALFDDRVGIGGYDDDTGLLQVFVDTDDTAAVEWGERLFEQFREEATRL